MKYYRDTEAMIIYSLDELRKEFANLIVESAPEYDDADFNSWLADCTKRYGTLEELQLSEKEPDEDSSPAECMRYLIMTEKDIAHLRSTWNIFTWNIEPLFTDEDASMIRDALDYMEYKLEKEGGAR